jgi:hypothetical protein
VGRSHQFFHAIGEQKAASLSCSVYLNAAAPRAPFSLIFQGYTVIFVHFSTAPKIGVFLFIKALDNPTSFMIFLF